MKCQRIIKELNIKEVAKQTGLSPSTIKKIERGAKDFHILNLKSIMGAMNVDIKRGGLKNKDRDCSFGIIAKYMEGICFDIDQIVTIFHLINFQRSKSTPPNRCI